MKNIVKILAAAFCLSLFLLVGCGGGGPSVPGAVKVTEAEMKSKLVGSWEQDLSELETEGRALAEMEGWLRTEHGKTRLEDKLKDVYRRYEFKEDGTYQLDSDVILGNMKESGTWEMTKNVNRPEQLGLFLSFSERGKHYTDVHYLEGDKIMLQYGGDDHIHTLTRVK
ncbi:hypothetical protein N9Y42_05075 [Mariniblastus sp.]|nr:hypothetical protein [Mariniblastus sp.]